jgi:hypothetical protein
MARLSADPGLGELVRERLTLEGLSAEARLLRERPDFERPYGRAWLLLLLRELGQPGQLPAPLLRLRRDVHGDVVAWLDGAPADALLAAEHGSWLFTLLLATLAAEGDERDRLDALRLRRLEPARPAIERRAPRPTDFADLTALLDVLDALRGEPLTPPDPGESEGDHCHDLGRRVTQLWPWAVAARRSSAARQVLDRHVGALLLRSGWLEDFMTSHWVPQFLWFAEALASDPALGLGAPAASG